MLIFININSKQRLYTYINCKWIDNSNKKRVVSSSFIIIIKPWKEKTKERERKKKIHTIEEKRRLIIY